MIHFSFLGQFSIKNGAGRIADIQTRRGAELLAFLILKAGRSYDRGHLAEQFWGHLPEDRARRAFNTELWRITRALKDIGVDTDQSLPKTQTQVSYVAHPDHLVDIDILNAAMSVVQSTNPADATQEAIKAVEAGVKAYRGDLLETVYSDWCLLWRENLRAQHTEALEFLLEVSMARQDWATAIRYGRELLALDPLMEHIHRALMRCHFHNGNRPLAMRQYALCEQLLREELDVEPMDETRRIQETILAVPGRRVENDVQSINVPRRRSDDTRSPVQKVDMALSNLNTARHWLEEVSVDLRR